MPMKWVVPDVAVAEVGPNGPVVVYCGYKDGDYERPLSFWFRLDPCENDDDLFDVRDLKTVTFTDAAGGGDHAAVRELLRAAIRSGEIKPLNKDE